MAKIEVVKGSMNGAVLQLEHTGQVIIGRDAQVSNLILSNPKVSRRHCMVKVSAGGNGFDIFCYSRNGLMLSNGRKLQANESASIAGNVQIILGNNQEIINLILDSEDSNPIYNPISTPAPQSATPSVTPPPPSIPPQLVASQETSEAAQFRVHESAYDSSPSINQVAQNYSSDAGYNYQSSQTLGKVTYGTKVLLKRIIPILRHPVEELKEIGEFGEKALGLQMILLSIVVYTLFLIIAMSKVRAKMSGVLGEMSSYISIPYLTIIITGVGVLAAVYFAMLGILYGLTKLFAGNTEVTFGSIVTVVGGKALYDAVVLILGVVITMIQVKAGTIVFAVGTVFSILLMIITYTELVSIDGDRKLYALSLSYLCMAIIAYVVLNYVLGTLMTTIVGSSVNSLSNMLNDIGGSSFY